ncbi:hypothetical protein GIB67_033872 [Kingdonia uniflora]|uniref:Uncharacterized protein n=1 Tax=Kingdonia uniflora TaxID=39325 RepID=A0A7J7MIX4_9MAGN|nr:hypothetical protein GIB67_033872 [Kingdonia uniflora]
MKEDSPALIGKEENMEAGKLMDGALLGKVNGMEVELTIGLVNQEGTLKMLLMECDCNVNDISITLVGRALWISSDKIGATIYLDMTIDVLDDNRILQVACISVVSLILRWINFKVQFNEVFGGVRCNLKEAVQLASIFWEGRPHCCLYDARNTARLLTNLMSRGFSRAVNVLLLWSEEQHMHGEETKSQDAHALGYAVISRNNLTGSVRLDDFTLTLKWSKIAYEHNIDEVVQDLLNCLDSPELPFLQWQEIVGNWKLDNISF